jgi:hypothetical protein
LAKLILSSPNPMTFAEIMAIAYPEGGCEGDMAKALGNANVGRVRSLRRALRRLCDDGIIMLIGEGGRGDPRRYWKNPMLVAMSGDKESWRKLTEQISADPALTAAANAAAKKMFS